MQKELKYIKRKIDILCIAIMGDPTNPDNPGYNIRIDRLEQSNKLKNKILCVLGIGVVSSFLRIIISFFK